MSNLQNNNLQEVQLQIKKLILLLRESGMPDKVQDSWIKILSKMSMQQIDRFIDILESKFLNKVTGKIDEEYKEKIEKVLLEFKEKKEKTSKSFDEALKKFNNNLNI